MGTILMGLTSNEYWKINQKNDIDSSLLQTLDNGDQWHSGINVQNFFYKGMAIILEIHCFICEFTGDSV